MRKEKKPIFSGVDRSAFMKPVIGHTPIPVNVEIVEPATPASTTAKFYTVRELSELLQVHENTILMEIKRRKLGATKVANVWRISQIAVDNYLASQTIKTSSI